MSAAAASPPCFTFVARHFCARQTVSNRRGGLGRMTCFALGMTLPFVDFLFSVGPRYTVGEIARIAHIADSDTAEENVWNNFGDDQWRSLYLSYTLTESLFQWTNVMALLLQVTTPSPPHSSLNYLVRQSMVAGDDLLTRQRLPFCVLCCAGRRVYRARPGNLPPSTPLTNPLPFSPLTGVGGWCWAVADW